MVGGSFSIKLDLVLLTTPLSYKDIRVHGRLLVLGDFRSLFSWLYITQIRFANPDIPE